jgi:hypothetical protein
MAGPVAKVPRIALIGADVVAGPCRTARREAPGAAEELGGEEQGNLVPGEVPGHRQGDRHRRIDVGPAELFRDHHGREDAQPPAHRNHNPAATASFGALEADVGDHAIAQEDQDHRPNEFRRKLTHTLSPTEFSSR